MHFRKVLLFICVLTLVQNKQGLTLDTSVLEDNEPQEEITEVDILNEELTGEDLEIIEILDVLESLDFLETDLSFLEDYELMDVFDYLGNYVEDSTGGFLDDYVEGGAGDLLNIFDHSGEGNEK